MNRETLLRCFPSERGRLVASLARLVGPTDAEDLANETLLRALDAVDGFRGDAALGTWLHRIGVNFAYDLLRRRERSPVVAADQNVNVLEAVADTSDCERLERKQMTRCVQNLLAKLPPQQRHVLALADMLEQSAPEIARDAGVTTGNVKIRLHRARRAMKSVLETHCDFDHGEAGVLCCTPKAER